MKEKRKVVPHVTPLYEGIVISVGIKEIAARLICKFERLPDYICTIALENFKEDDRYYLAPGVVFTIDSIMFVDLKTHSVVKDKLLLNLSRINWTQEHLDSSEQWATRIMAKLKASPQAEGETE